MDDSNGALHRSDFRRLHPGCLRRSFGPRKTKTSMKTCWPYLAGYLLIAISAPGADIDALVHRAEQRLHTVAKVEANIKIVQGAATAAHASGEIDVSRNEVAKLVSAAQPNQEEAIVMFILAHELAHVLQYREYVIAGKYTEPSWSHVIEAQADLLSGLWVGRTLYSPENLEQETAETDPEVALTAARLFFDLGSEPFSVGEHPSRQARRTAVRLGLAASLVQGARNMANPRIPQELRDTYLNNPQAILDSLPLKSAAGNQDFSIPWTLRVAEALVHAEPPAARMLEVTFDFNASGFNPDPSKATAKHTAKFLNKGTKPLRVYWEPALVFKRRKDPEESLWWRRMPLASEVREFVLAPKASRTLKVNYDWNLEANKYFGSVEEGRKYMPAFIAPIKDEALWSVTFADEAGPPKGRTQQDLVIRYSTENEIELRDALSSIYVTLLGNSIEQNACSPMWAMAIDGKPDSRDFALAIGFPGAAVKGHRYDDDGSYSLSVSREFMKDESAASAFFDELVRTLKLIPDLKLVPNPKLRESSDKSTTVKSKATFKSKGVSISAELRSVLRTDPEDMQRKNHYEVSLWGHPANR